jgi:signal transduction histidine kinase
MKLLRNHEAKSVLILHLAVTAVFSAAAAFSGIYAFLLVWLMSAILLAVHLYLMSCRYSEIAELCDDIDRILSGNESVKLEKFEEGEIGILKSEVGKMTVKLREQNSALKKDKLLLKDSMADISHQLRTPFTSMNLIVTLLGKQDLSAEQQAKYLRELSELLNRTDWLIEDLLKLSQLDAGVVQLKSERISAKKLLKTAVEPLEIPIELHGITLEISADESELNVDGRWTCEALCNIFKNCMEHTPSGGRIHAAATDNALCTEITITDSGNGISEKDLPHIFERFYKSDRSSQGFGIGLSLAHRVITLQNGIIYAENRTPHGACFRIRFYKSCI